MAERKNKHILGTLKLRWKKLHLKVSQGGARGARMNFFKLG